MKAKKLITIVLTAAIVLSSAAAFSSCQFKNDSQNGVPATSESSQADTDSAVESKEAASEEVSSKEEEEKKTEESQKAESKKNESKKDSAIYQDMVGLIKEENVLGYTVTKLVGSEDDHLIIAYGKKDTGKTDDTDTSNIIILDPDAFASEQAEKEAARIDALEATKLYSVYKISGNLAVPEGDLDGYFTTPYISPNTATPGLYFAKGSDWKYGVIEIQDGSAVVNYSESGSVKEENESLPPLPGAEVEFNAPNKFDLLEKYK